MEACLELALTKQAAPKEIKGKTRKIVEFTCDPTCGPEPKKALPYRDKEGKGKEGNGSYAYCVCCAETQTKLNKLHEDKNDRKFSVVDRVFYGTKTPDGGKGNAKQEVEKKVKAVKEVHGEVILEDPDESFVGPPAPDSEPSLRYVFQFPKFSVERRIAALRNGCAYCESPPCKISEKGTACPLEELGLKYGICPAISEILKDWDKINAAKNPQRDAETIRKWIEASMGHSLTGRAIKAMVYLDELHRKNVPEAGGKLKRFLDAWCDASAVRAFTRYHTEFQARMNDHLTLNRQVTERDKAQLIGLMSRVSEQLSLSQADEGANYTVESVLTGLSVAHDRSLASSMSAAVASDIQGQANAQSRSGEVSSFGRLSELYVGDGAGNAGGRAAGRTMDPIESTLSAFD